MIKGKEVLVNKKWPLKMLDFRATMLHWDWWEQERLAAMYTAIKPGDIVLDIGAEQGDLSCLFNTWGAETILVEPSPGFWPNIHATYEMNNQKPLKSFQCLVSNITVADEPASDEQWPEAVNGDVSDSVGFSHLNEHPKIPVYKIDDLPLEHVDVITMDIEGSEYEAIEGATELIKRDHPILFISVHPEFMWREHHHSTDDFHIMLQKMGYEPTFLAFDHEKHYMYKYKGDSNA